MATNFDDIIERYENPRLQLGDLQPTAAPSPTAPAASTGRQFGEGAILGAIDRAAAPQRDPITQEYRPSSMVGGQGSSATGSVLGSFYEAGGRSIAALPRAANELITGVSNKITGENRATSSEDFLERFATGIERGVARVARPNDDYRDLITAQLASGLGSTVGVAAGTAAGGLPGGMAAGAAALGVEGVEDYKESVERLGGEFDANKSFNVFLANSAIGTTEALPIMQAFNRLDKATGGQLDNKIGEILKGGAEEAIQEGVQTLASNWIASDLVAYDPDRNVFEDTAEAAALGGGVGLILNAIMVGAGMDPISFREQARTKGPLEQAVTDNGTAVPVDAEAEATAEAERVEEAAQTNPVTGDPIATKEIADINKFYQQAIMAAEGARTEEDRAAFEAEAERYKARLEELATPVEEPKAADIKATAEAQEVLSTMSDSATSVPEPTTPVLDTDEITRAEQERLARIADVNLPEAESEGGIFTPVVEPAEVERTVDEVASTVWDAMTRNAPATDEQLAVFKNNFPEWYQTNIETPTTIIGTSDQNNPRLDLPEAQEAEVEAAVNGTKEEAPAVIRAASGRPYKTEAAARNQLNRRGLQETHEITQEADGGYVLSPRTVQTEEPAVVPEDPPTPTTPEEAETLANAVEAVSPVEDIPVAPIEEAPIEENPIIEAVEEQEASPRPLEDIYDDVIENGIESNLDEIVRGYGSVKAFQDAVIELQTMPAVLREQQGIEDPETLTPVTDEDVQNFTLQEEAGFDPETDEGIESQGFYNVDAVDLTNASLSDISETAYAYLSMSPETQDRTPRQRGSLIPTYPSVWQQAVQEAGDLPIRERAERALELFENNPVVRRNEQAGVDRINEALGPVDPDGTLAREEVLEDVAGGRIPAAANDSTTTPLTSADVRIGHRIGKAKVKELFPNSRDTLDKGGFLVDLPGGEQALVQKYDKTMGEASDNYVLYRQDGTEIDLAAWTREDIPGALAGRTLPPLATPATSPAPVPQQTADLAPRAKKAAIAKVEIDNTSKSATAEEVISSLETQIETAINEGRDTRKLELALEIKQREVAKLAKEAARAKKVREGSVKRATDKDVDNLIEGIANGEITDVGALDAFDEFVIDDDLSYIFAGAQAETADGGALVKAVGQLSVGRDADEVRQSTGWFQGPDKEFRFEIDDSKASFKYPEAANFQEMIEKARAEKGRGIFSIRSVVLEDVFDHPELFEAYPSLRSIHLVPDPTISGQSAAINTRYRNGQHSFTIKLPSYQGNRDILLDSIVHEIQHAVQYLEGFALGGNAGMFTDHYQKQLAQRTQWRAEFVAKEVAAWGASSERLMRSMPKSEVHDMMESLYEADPEYRTLLNRLTTPIQTDYDMYMNLAGEVEARDVSARLKLSSAERANTLPALADDVQIADVIIRRQGDSLSSLLSGLETSESRIMPNGVKRYRHKPEAKAKISAAVARFNNNSDSVNIQEVDTISALPPRVKRDLLARLSKGAKASSVQGLYDDRTGTVYIITNTVANAQEAEVVLMHELVGHYGVKKTFEAADGNANAYNNMLDKESKRNPDLMFKAASLVYERGYRDIFLDVKPQGYSQQVIIDGQVKYLTSDGAITVLDEFIAFKAEEFAADPVGLGNQYGSFRKRLITAIRHMFTRLGFTANRLTEEDIFAFIAESNARLFDLNNSSVVGFLQRGRGIRYNIAKYTDPASPNFLPDAARVAGVAPVGSFNREKVAADAYEANYTPLQKKAKDLEEASDQQSLGQVLNLIQSGFGKTTVNQWESRVDAAWQQVMKNPFIQKISSLGSLSGISHKELYRSLQAVARGQVGKAEKKARTIDKVLKRMTPAQKKLTQEFFTTRDFDPAAIEGISASDRQALKTAKQDLIDYGQQLVDMGKLSPQVYLESKGMYLPKVYFKYVNSFGASGKRTSFMSYLRKQKELTREQAVNLGKIEDPSIIVPETIGTIGRDIALMRLTSNIVNTSVERNLGWVIGESFRVDYVTETGKTTTVSLYTLQEELARLQEIYSEGAGGQLFQRTEAELAQLGQRIEYVNALITKAEEARISEITEMLSAQGLTPEQITPDVVADYMKENYADMPVDPAYGALSGRKVMKSIKSDFVNNMGDDANIDDQLKAIWSSVETGHQYWKASKVVLNVPVSTVRNGIGNFILLDTSTNTNAGTLLNNFGEEFVNHFKEGQSRFWKYAEEVGLLGTTFSATELNRIKRGAVAEIEHMLKVEKAKGKRSASLILASAHSRRFMTKMFGALSDFYGWQEGLFKVVKMRDYIETWEKQNGVNIDDLPWAQKEAVILQGSLESSAAIFDYSEVPAYINTLRRTPFLGSPFVTFTYKSLLKMPENFVKHPQKFAKYAAATSTMVMGAIGAMFDAEWDDEEVDQVLSTMADYYDNSTAIALVPFKDGNGNLQIVDLTPFFPWASHTGFMKGAYSAIQEGGASGLLGVGGEFLDWSGFLSTPANDMIRAVGTNTDSFSGREIVPRAASSSEKLENVARYLWALTMPPVLTEQGALGHFLDNMGVDLAPVSQGRVLNRLGEDRETGWQVAGRLFGVNMVPQSADLNRANTLAARSRELRELAIRRGQIQRDRNIQSNEERARQLREIQERIKQTHEKYNNRLNNTAGE